MVRMTPFTAGCQAAVTMRILALRPFGAAAYISLLDPPESVGVCPGEMRLSVLSIGGIGERAAGAIPHRRPDRGRTGARYGGQRLVAETKPDAAQLGPAES